MSETLPNLSRQSFPNLSSPTPYLSFLTDYSFTLTTWGNAGKVTPFNSPWPLGIATVAKCDGAVLTKGEFPVVALFKPYRLQGVFFSRHQIPVICFSYTLIKNQPVVSLDFLSYTNFPVTSNLNNSSLILAGILAGSLAQQACNLIPRFQKCCLTNVSATEHIYLPCVQNQFPCTLSWITSCSRLASSYTHTWHLFMLSNCSLSEWMFNSRSLQISGIANVVLQFVATQNARLMSHPHQRLCTCHASKC